MSGLRLQFDGQGAGNTEIYVLSMDNGRLKVYIKDNEIIATAFIRHPGSKAKTTVSIYDEKIVKAMKIIRKPKVIKNK